MKKLRFFLVLILFTGFTYAVWSQTDFWDPVRSPWGGKVYALAVKAANGYIFAGTPRGVYRSVDGGETWVISGLQGATVFALEVNAGGDVFAGSSSGVARSTDDGGNWVLQPGLSTPVVRAVAFGSGNTVFAGGNGGVVQRSEDNGDTWTRVHDGVYFATDVEGLVVNNQGHVYAGVYGGGGVWLSKDQGLTWEPANDGLTSAGVVSLAIKTSNQYLFAGTNGYLFRSTDGGDNWTPLGTPVVTTVFDIEVHPGGAIFAATDDGVFRSQDEGNTWRERNFNLANTVLRSIAVSGYNFDIFVGSNGEGTFRSTSFGDNWEQVGLPSPAIFALALDAGGAIFAGTNDSLFVSTDNGRNWQRRNKGIADPRIPALAIDRRGGRVFAATWAGVLVSSDKGKNWTPMNNGLSDLTVLSLGYKDNGYLFAGGRSGVFRYQPNVNQWVPVNSGLSDTHIGAMTIDESTGDLYVSTLLEGVFRSTNDGDFWTSRNEGWMFPPQIVTLAVDTARRVLFAGSSGQGVYRAPVAGGDWVSIPNGIPNGSNANVGEILVHPVGRLFVGIFDQGVYQSVDIGDNWTEVNGGLKTYDVNAFVVDAAGLVYAGSGGGSGLYRSIDFTTAVRNAGEDEGEAILLPCRPNPFHSGTTLVFSLIYPAYVDLSIFDAGGKKIAALLSQRLPAGTHSVDWDARGIASGAYYCRLQAGPRVKTQQLVLIRR